MAKLVRVNSILLYNLHKIMFSSSTSAVKTVGLLVIGDEILKGQVVDSNSHYITKRLHQLGLKVEKITVTGDNKDEISEEVKNFSLRYDYVITTGGIGPTHDDVTFESVAEAFNEPVILHPELVKICAQFYGTTDPESPGMKLARVPKSSKLTFAQEDGELRTHYPNVSVRNVYMFPGIPQLCERLFDKLSGQLFETTNQFYTRNVYFNVTEEKIANALSLVVAEYPGVLIGSYPELFNRYYKVRIVLESSQEQEMEQAYVKLLQIVPREVIVPQEKFFNK
uniref:MoaB/Mog domain-containing protein n=3 Tax=Photinus pyralis TaxID=7054 RepID=A0A1Y1LCC3_PHOPY